jgi:hypothetical protein
MCEICGNSSGEPYCGRHQIACDNLVEGYEKWRSAVDISWKTYLKEVYKNKLTGQWVKEVIQRLLCDKTEKTWETFKKTL